MVLVFVAERPLLLHLAHLLADLPVKGQQQPVVILVRPDERIRVLPEVSSSGLIDDIIPDHIILRPEVLGHSQPHLDEPIIHAVLVGEEVVGEADHVVGEVVVEEGFLHAVLLQGVALGVATQVYLYRCGEGEGLDEPAWESLAAELPAVEVVVRVQENGDAVGLSLSDDVPEDGKICVVVLSFFGLKSLPG